jgi:hypothetical protein
MKKCHQKMDSLMKKYYCVDCGIKITYGHLRCIKCRNRYLSLTFVKGIPKSEKTKKKLSIKAKIRLKNPKNHPLYIDGRSVGHCKCSCCGKPISESSVHGKGRCFECYISNLSGKNNPAFIDGRTTAIHTCLICNNPISYTSWSIGNQTCSNCYQKSKDGKNNPNYIHGKGYAPYCSSFAQIRKQIRKRDNYVCKICGIKEINLNKNLCVHHIDYNKENNKNNNLILLCSQCHLRTNFNRDYWYAHCTYLMENR